MNNFILIILTGFLVRADGFGTSNPRFKRIAEFFSVFTCAPLFGLLIYLTHGGLLVSLASAVAFLVWRLPGFRNGGLPNFVLRRLPYRFKVKWLAPENGWQHWRNMFVRGFWTSAFGFSLISLAAHGYALGALVALPFSLVYMTIYSGGYAYAPQNILGYDRQVWVEHASGWAFAVFVMGVI